MNTLLYTIFIIIIANSLTQAQGIKFQEGDLQSLASKAGKKKKLLLVDTYADWCGPCKIMDKDIFPQKEIGDFYNKKFIATKLNVETLTGEAFSDKHKIQSIPTFFFLDENETVIFRKTGATKNVIEFIEYGQTALDIYALKTQQKAIERPKSLLYYAYFLKENQDTLYNTYLNKFLAAQPNWETAEIMQIIIDLAETEGSQALEYFVNNQEKFEEILGTSVVAEKRLLLILDKSIQFLQAVPAGQKPDMNQLQPAFEKYFGAEKYKHHFLLFQFRYYQQQEDYVSMRSVLQRFVEEVIKPMPDGREKAVEYINTAAIYFETAHDNTQYKFEAIQWGEKAIEMDQGADIYTILATLCENAGLMEKAILYQQKANEVRKRE